MKNAANRKWEAIETAAAAWLARRDRGFTVEEAAAYARWRQADVRHDAAVADLALVWGALDDLSAVNSQQRAGGPAVAPPAAFPVRRRGSRIWWWTTLGLAAALAILISVRRFHYSTARPEAEITRFETIVGAQRTIALADGSALRLNTNTAVTVTLGADERRVMLERGETFFLVARDPARPFVVIAGPAETRVLGTAFAVRRHERGSTVLVTEGEVRFGAVGGAGQRLLACQTASVTLGDDGDSVVGTLTPVEVARRLAWRNGMLEFNDTPLGEAITEINRYHHTRLVARDAATAAVRVGGSFSAENLDGFVRLLETFEVVVVARNANEIILGLKS